MIVDGFPETGRRAGGVPPAQEVALRIPCRLNQSRHGTFYYRYQFSVNGTQQERRISFKKNLRE
jgi:hypothetical protein